MYSPQTVGRKVMEEYAHAWNLRQQSSFPDTLKVSLREELIGTRHSAFQNFRLTPNLPPTFFEKATKITTKTTLSAFSESTEGEGGHREHEQVSQNFHLFPSLTIVGGSATHNTTISGIYQEFDVNFPLLDVTKLDESNTVTVSHGVSNTSDFSVNSSLNYVTGDLPGCIFTTTGASIGEDYALIAYRLNTNLTHTPNFNTFESEMALDLFVIEGYQLNGSLTTSYRVTSSTSFQLNIRSQNHSIRQGNCQSFSRLEGRFKFQNRL